MTPPYYGGVNYGYGYTGVGFQGGYWDGGAFFYNHAVANFGHVNIVNVYTTPVTVHVTTRVSFNGGQGGVQARPTAEERVAMTQRHVGPTPLQTQHEMSARAMPAMHASQNGGHPQILTTRRDELETLARGLLEFETLSGDEIKDLLIGKRPRRESVIEPAAPRSSAVPTAGKPRPRPETGGMEPQPQA